MTKSQQELGLMYVRTYTRAGRDALREAGFTDEQIRQAHDAKIDRMTGLRMAEALRQHFGGADRSASSR